MTFGCDFDFTSYPFDKHDCNMDFGTDSQAINTGMNFASIHYLNNTKGQELKDKVPVEIKHLPFSFLISANKEYGYPNYNYMYPVTGITIHMKRNDIGLLISGFYIPMASFSILSMLSYFISHESVTIMNSILNKYFLFC